jgi:hypothetical protein
MHVAFGPVRGLLTTMAGIGLALLGAPDAGARPTQRETPTTPSAPAPPAPANVTLVIDAPTPRGPWTMRVTNRGDIPVVLTADARLLTLDVTPRGASKPEHCELPPDMRPPDDQERPLVLPPNRSYSERFEPRLYCLSGKRLDALGPGSVVVASLGWSGRGVKPPLEVSAIAGLESQVAARKTIVAEPVALPDEPTSPPSPVDVPAGRAAEDTGWTRLVLRAPVSLDAASPGEIAIPVTLRNDGDRAALVRFRPETLAFEVVGPAGADHCHWPATAAAPIRELFTTIAPRAEVELTVLLSAYCAAHALDQAGLLVVRPSLDTRDASGVDVGLRSFDGQVIATAATIVRLRHGGVPRPLLRPKLEPVP